MTTVAAARRARKARNVARRANAGARRPSPEVLVMRAIRKVAAETAKHSVLWRLRQRGLIDHRQWQAGVRLQQDERASRDLRISSLDADVGGTGAAPVQRLERQAAALASFRAAWAALGAAGAGIAADVLAVCVHEQEPRALVGPRMPRRLLVTSANPDEVALERGRVERGIVVGLRIGLDTLAKHYGG